MNLTISDVFSEAWSLTKRHGLTFAVIFFLVWFFSLALEGTIMPMEYWRGVFSNDIAMINRYSGMGGWRNFVYSFFQLLVSIGVIVAMLGLARGGRKGLTWSCYRLSISTYLKYVGYMILVGIIVFVGSVFLILPGIYLWVRLAFGQVYLLDHPDADIDEAFRFSWRATEGKEFSLLGLGIVSFFVTLSGLLLCCIGIFYTMVISGFALVITYLWLLGDDASAPKATFTQTEGTAYQTGASHQTVETPRRETPSQPTEASRSTEASGKKDTSHQENSSRYDRTKY